MRLDEWQKYVEAQFLEEDPAPPQQKPQAAKPSADAAALNAQPPTKKTEAAETSKLAQPDSASESGRSEPLPEASIPVVVTSHISLPTDMPDGPQPTLLTIQPVQPQSPSRSERRKSNRNQAISIYPVFAPPTDKPSQAEPSSTSAVKPASAPIDTSAVDVAPTDSSSHSAAAVDPAPHPEMSRVLGRPPAIEANIPSFERYLPPTHPASRPQDPQIAADSPVSDSMSFALRSPLEESRQTDTDQQTPEHLRDSAGVYRVSRPRRAPKSRARHARNVRPQSIASGLSASELWATVPKHVKTLLQLERQEEEQEVAQYSYKRPFQEKRHELIERLLDPILSLEETARLLNVCPTTVRRYTNKGILTYYRKEPEHSTRSASTDSAEKETRQRRFRLSDILAFLEAQQAAIEADRQAERHTGRVLRDDPADTDEPPLNRTWGRRSTQAQSGTTDERA